MYSPAGFTVGVILIAAGAILVWGVTGEVSGVDIDAVGWILMAVGGVAALISMIFWAGPWGGPGYRRREYVEDDPYYRPRGRRRVVEEEEDSPTRPS